MPVLNRIANPAFACRNHPPATRPAPGSLLSLPHAQQCAHCDLGDLRPGPVGVRSRIPGIDWQIVNPVAQRSRVFRSPRPGMGRDIVARGLPTHPAPRLAIPGCHERMTGRAGDRPPRKRQGECPGHKPLPCRKKIGTVGRAPVTRCVVRPGFRQSGA